jgi:hypothetical protein
MNGEKIRVELFSPDGKNIYSASENVNSNSWNKVLDISTFADGTYFLKITSEKNVVIRKILKE